MPKFMDVHHGMHGVTPEALKEAHQADVDIQDDEGVDFQRAWGDPESGMVWCISEAPSAEACSASTSEPAIPRPKFSLSRSRYKSSFKRASRREARALPARLF